MKTAVIEYKPGPWPMREDALALVARHIGRPVTLAEIAPQHADHAGHPEVAAHDPRRAAAGDATTGGVAVLPLRGMITPYPSLMSLLFGRGGGLVSFRRALRAAVSSDEVSAIVLDIDSPGGVSDLVTETAAEIRKARESKRVVAVANTLAASAAYWLASQASEVSVTPSGMVGSVGVYLLHDDYSRYWEGMGIKPTYIYAGRYKVEANSDEPLSDEAAAYLQQIVDDCYGQFVTDVAKGRGVSPATVRNDFGEGRCLTAKAAVSAGLADRVETFEQAVTRLVGARGGRRAEGGEGVAAGDDEQLAQIRAQLDDTTQSLKEGK